LVRGNRQGFRRVPINSLAVRRFAPFALLVLMLAGCGSGVPGRGHTTTPTPETIIGKPPRPTTIVGVPAAGKRVFVDAGCGACHIFTPAGTTGKVGPNLDNLATYAKAANQALIEFTKSSIVDPNAYIAPGYKANIMPGNYGTTLTPKQLADLVAFLVKTP
jgi:cytochrome c551/c552